MNLVQFREHTYFDVLDKDSIVIDIGANKGDFTRHIKQKYGCHVDLYEPCKDVSPGYACYRIAIGPTHGETTFYCFGKPFLSGSLKKRYKRAGVVEGWDYELRNAYQVPTITLADAMKDYKCVDLIKMDVEGMEFDIIKATTIKTLKKVQQLEIEMHTGEYKGFDRAYGEKDVLEVLEKMRRAGFKENVNVNSKQVLFYQL